MMLAIKILSFICFLLSMLVVGVGFGETKYSKFEKNAIGIFFLPFVILSCIVMFGI